MNPRLFHHFIPVGLVIFVVLALCVPNTIAQGQEETPAVPAESILPASQTVPGEHSITLSIPDDGLGNGSFFIDAIELVAED